MSSLSRRVRRLIVAAVLLGGAGAAVAQGSREQAQAVVDEARRETAEARHRYEQANRDCAREILVNACREKARRERDQQLRAIREKEVAARDTLRGLDAEARAEARAQRSAEQAAEPKAGGATAPRRKDAPAAGSAAPAAGAARAVDPSEQEAAAAKRRAEAASRKAASEKRATEQAADRERRAAEQAEKQAQVPAQIERYEERQRAAEARAEEKKRIAEEHRQRREKRAEERSAAQKQSQGANPQ